MPSASRSPSIPSVRVMRRRCSEVRASFHNSAGLITSPAPSKNTELCICPVSPTAATLTRLPLLAPAAAIARLDASPAFCHQSRGSCSDHPGRGVSIACSTSPSPKTLPSSATTTTFTAVVPMSMPRTACVASPISRLPRYAYTKTHCLYPKVLPTFPKNRNPIIPLPINPRAPRFPKPAPPRHLLSPAVSRLAR